MRAPSSRRAAARRSIVSGAVGTNVGVLRSDRRPVKRRGEAADEDVLHAVTVQRRKNLGGTKNRHGLRACRCRLGCGAPASGERLGADHALPRALDEGHGPDERFEPLGRRHAQKLSHLRARGRVFDLVVHRKNMRAAPGEVKRRARAESKRSPGGVDEPNWTLSNASSASNPAARTRRTNAGDVRRQDAHRASAQNRRPSRVRRSRPEVERRALSRTVRVMSGPDTRLASA